MGFSLFVLLFLFTLNFIWAWKIKLISLWNFLFLLHSFAFLLQLFALHLDFALNILKWWGFLILFVFWWNLFEINFWLLYCLFFINFCARFHRAKVLSEGYLVIGFLFCYQKVVLLKWGFTLKFYFFGLLLLVWIIWISEWSQFFIVIYKLTNLKLLVPFALFSLFFSLLLSPLSLFHSLLVRKVWVI